MMSRNNNEKSKTSTRKYEDADRELDTVDHIVRRSSKPQREEDANRDPITGTPGAHPIGVGAGAVGGGATGAVIGGVVGGPIGAGVGAVVGAVSGGLAGKGIAEAVNPTVEHAYWRSEYSNRPYIEAGSKYEQYAPAYQFGWESYDGRCDERRTFDDMESELRDEWESRSENANLSWKDARAAARDAWQRREARACAPDSD